MLIGTVATTWAFFLPWFSLDEDRLDLFSGVLMTLGLVPDFEDPVRGCDIPSVISDDLDHPVIQAGAGLNDLAEGRLDRFGGRIFFGDREGEESGDWVLLPLVLSLCSLAFLRFPDARLFIAWVILLDLIILGFGLFWWFRVTRDDAEIPLLVHHGYVVTLGAMALLALTLGLHFRNGWRRRR